MKKALRTLAAALLALFCGYLLLTEPAGVGAGVRRGLVICGSVAIPSLFPFLILANLASGARALQPLFRPLGPVARRLYLLPERASPALLLSWIGGYPAGARVLSELLRRGEITHDDAAYGLAVCINSSPAFLASAVGAGVFGSAKIGLRLYLCQLAAGLLTGRILALFLRRGTPEKAARGNEESGLPLAEAFVSAVSGAAGGLLNICAFLLAFSALLGGLQALGVPQQASEGLSRLTGGLLRPEGAQALLSGALEICCGCARAQALPPAQAALILPFLVSFSGLSVICQTAAIFSGSGVRMGPMAAGRALHGVLTALLATPRLYLDSLARGAFAPAGVTLAQGSSAAGGAALLLLCALLYLSIGFSFDLRKRG